MPSMAKAVQMSKHCISHLGSADPQINRTLLGGSEKRLRVYSGHPEPVAARLTMATLARTRMLGVISLRTSALCGRLRAKEALQGAVSTPLLPRRFSVGQTPVNGCGGVTRKRL